MKQFSAPGSKIACIPLENLEGVKRGAEAGGVKEQPGTRDGGEGQREKIQKGLTGNKRFEDGWGRSAALA